MEWCWTGRNADPILDRSRRSMAHRSVTNTMACDIHGEQEHEEGKITPAAIV